jgi:membrane fusion protein, heavy metal efflux system
MRRLENRICLPGALLWGALLAACGDDAKKGATPATIANPTTESALTTITLSAEAAQRLGIETMQVESVAVRATRTVGGEVMAPPGLDVIVSAPVAGTVVTPVGTPIVASGANVVQGAELMRLVPLPADRDLLRSGEALTIAEAKFAQVSAESQRVAKLYADKLVSARDLERAQTDLTTARAELDAARAQVEMARGQGKGDNRALTAFHITAPMSGVVQQVHVAPGQPVAAGSPLVQIAQLDRVWVRVPLYAGDVRSISRGEVIVSTLGDAGVRTWRGVPVTAPRQGDPGAASVDLYYEVASRGALRSGERVTVSLPSAGAATERRVLAVPMGAILYDVYGGTWTYVAKDSIHMVRTRVELGDIVDGRAIIVRGLTPGVRVVTAGAAELFGTEFGVGK